MYAARQLLLNSRGVAKMATNAGKTEVMAVVLKALGPGVRALIIVHRKELMYQTRERLIKRLERDSIGILGDGRASISGITVAMVQSLANKPILAEYFLSNNVVMVDECHHVSSNQMLDVLYQVPGFYRFGFSGTPLKYDKLADLKLIGATGPIVVDITNADLIGGGWSAIPNIVMYTIMSDDSGIWEADYQTAYTRMIVHNDERNDVISNVAREHRKLGKLVLILVSRIEHGQLLHNSLPGSIFVHGSHGTDYRRSVLDGMRSNSPGIVIASPIFDEGIDVPGVDVIIIAAGGKSHIKLLQRVGRGLRRKSGRNEVVVVDFIDDTNKYLLAHSEERIDTYAKEEFKMELAKHSYSC